MTLSEFLLARIAEDEADWRAVDVREVVQLLHGRPIAPRMLAECEAKRRIVEDFETHARDYREAPSPFAEGRRHAALLAVTRIAETYADHPDYREEWKP